jgi:hypothetical protein
MGVEGERMSVAGIGAGVGDLGPILAVPLPRIAAQRGPQGLAAEEHGSLAVRVEGERVSAAADGAGIGDLRPILEQIAPAAPGRVAWFKYRPIAPIA